MSSTAATVHDAIQIDEVDWHRISKFPSDVAFLSRSRQSALVRTLPPSRRLPGVPSWRLQCWSCDPTDAFDESSQRAQVIEESAAAALNVLNVPTPPRISVRPAFEPDPSNKGSRIACSGHRRTAVRTRKFVGSKQR